MSRAFRLALLAATAVAALTGVAAAAPPAEVKRYTASANLEGAAVTVTLTNTSTSTHSFGSAEVRLPTAAGLGAAALSAAPSGWSASSRTEGALTVLRLVSSGKGTTSGIAPNGSLALRFPVLATTPPGEVLFSTQVKQSNDFSGVGNDFTRSGPEPSVTLTAPAQVPTDLEFVQGPSDVQVSSTAGATPGTTPITVMCPPPTVRVVDASGATVTSLPPTTVRLAPVGADPGLRLDGSTDLASTTSSGVATFGSAPSADGTCASGLTAEHLGLDYRLAATAVLADGTVLTTQAATVFDVLSFYADCDDQCTSPVLTSGGTTAQVSATGGTGAADRLLFTVGQDQWTQAFATACDPDANATGPNPYRAVVTVDLADHDKVVQLRWDKQAVQWATDNGTPRWEVCTAAAYEFAAVGGPATPVVADGAAWWVGALLACADAPDDRTPCVSSLSRSGGEQLATVLLPNVPGDPRMI